MEMAVVAILFFPVCFQKARIVKKKSGEFGFSSPIIKSGAGRNERTGEALTWQPAELLSRLRG